VAGADLVLIIIWSGCGCKGRVAGVARLRRAPPPQPIRPAGGASWRSLARGPVVRKRAA